MRAVLGRAVAHGLWSLGCALGCEVLGHGLGDEGVLSVWVYAEACSLFDCCGDEVCGGLVGALLRHGLMVFARAWFI